MKQAFLIMAHNKYQQLDLLLRLLDHPLVDIFLHIDKKSMMYTPIKMEYSKLTIIPSIKVMWGGYSQIQCELNLLKAATQKEEYEFYHFLTGQDLPLKSIDEIVSFFHENTNSNFIHFDSLDNSMDKYGRIMFYRLFQDKMYPNKRTLSSVFQYNILLPIQKVLKVDRTRKYKNIVFRSGSAYYSIKHEFALYILGNEIKIKKWFANTVSGDEMFIQTLAYNSGFRETLFNVNECETLECNLRKIDWKRAKPYVWRSNDFEELINSGCIIARKFDIDIDEKIIYKIVQYCNKDKIEKSNLLSLGDKDDE